MLAAVTLTGCAGGAPASQSPVADVSIPPDPDGLAGIVLPRPFRVPQTSLVGTTGERFDLAAETRRPLTLVFFGYTHCPDVCQLVMANIASALVRLDERQRARVAMVFVTTDPARDTPRRLRDYLGRFDPEFQGVTGDLAAIVRLAETVNVPIEKGHRLASGGYDVTHGTDVLGVLPDDRVPVLWTQGAGPEALADDITRILEDKVTGL